jgi:hypothetical protein
VVSPNGVVIENWRSVPPSSVYVWMSSIGVPPRDSSSANVRSMSSTSNTSVPTPSGCFARNRAARPPAPTGELHTMLMLPAVKHAEVCLPFASSAGVLRQVSAKSSLPV